MKDIIQEYLKLRQSLLKEKEELEKRLREIERALAGTPPSPGMISKRGRPKGIRTKDNQMTLREVVRKVTWEKALSRQEILEEVQKLGYKFSAANPLNSLNQVIYDRRHFVNLGGKFAPIDSPAAQQTQSHTSTQG